MMTLTNSDPPLHAFIDESGQRGRSPRSSDHFVMTAAVVPGTSLQESASVLAQLRVDLGRRPGDTLHWSNLKTHPQRLHLARTLGAQNWLTVSSVVVCKRHLPTPSPFDGDDGYLFTLSHLLTRLSWLARDRGQVLTYTLAHITRFKIATLRKYEAELRGDSSCKIDWSYLDPRGGSISQPAQLEQLQLADAAASATAAAFNTDTYGNTERRYLQELSPRLYRRDTESITSSGVMIYPWSPSTMSLYPWVSGL
ncbi:DUF3800 domain-containing protein [Amycolatopsis sp. NBC_00438]|uniref:DUF3800 domain-containing protein n=1 Tax=Amycolatopsis sp. NBC_00438 TaxID=2903558 RepID=UPI002E205648